MKKIIFSIVVLFGLSNVKAIEYNYSQWSLKYPDFIQNKIIIQSEDRFLWYKELKINKEYLPIDKFNNKLVDYNDYKIIKGEESIEKLDNKDDKEIIKTTKSYTFKSKKINKIHIDLSNIKSKINIENISLLDNSNNKINFDLNKKNNSYINDNIDIDLKEKIDADSVNLQIDYKIENPNYDKIFINMCNEYGYCVYYVDIILDSCLNNCNIVVNRFNIKENLTLEVDFYSYIEKLYATYDIKKEYVNGYYSNLDGYIKDEKTKKTYYRYITSDYVIINSSGKIVYEDNECSKNVCTHINIKKPIIENPETNDKIIIQIFIFIITLIMIIVVLKKSSFVDFNKS